MAEWTELAALHGVPPDLEGVPDERLTEILTAGTPFTSKMFFVSEASIGRLAYAVQVAGEHRQLPIFLGRLSPYAGGIGCLLIAGKQ